MQTKSERKKDFFFSLFSYIDLEAASLRKRELFTNTSEEIKMMALSDLLTSVPWL